MINYDLKIIPVTLLNDYLQQVPEGLQRVFNALKNAKIFTDTFSFYAPVPVMATDNHAYTLSLLTFTRSNMETEGPVDF